MSSNLSINKGKILIYRVFDIGEEVNLASVENLLKEKSISERYKLARNPKQAIIINDAPLSLHLGDVEIQFPDRKFSFTIIGKLWSYGTISMCFQFEIPQGTTWPELIKFASLFENPEQLDLVARNRAREFTQQISTCMKRTNEWNTYEDYVIYFFENIEGLGDNALTLLDKADIPSLILAENVDNLSDSIKKNVLEHTYQYAKNDLSIIDWNSALVIEPNGSMDVPDIIEFALNQLLEMRYYDDLLDDKLGKLYNSIENKKKSLLSDQYSDLAEEAAQRYLELSEIIETIENSFKVVGDFYLATIFRAASNRFRFKDWLSNINSKLSNFAEVSKVLQGEVHARRTQLSELIVILLIGFEVIPAIFKMIFY